MRCLENIIKELSPVQQREVVDFIDFLLEKSRKKTRHAPTFSWAGALEGMRNQYTSVELQHEISAWRSGEE